MKFDELHDAVIDDIHLDFENGTLRLTLTPTQWPGQPRTVEIVAHEWTHFACPREQPWGLGGHSMINTVDGPEDIAGGGSRLSIQLQSGDTMELRAKAFELRLPGECEK